MNLLFVKLCTAFEDDRQVTMLPYSHLSQWNYKKHVGLTPVILSVIYAAESTLTLVTPALAMRDSFVNYCINIIITVKHHHKRQVKLPERIKLD